MPTLTTSGSPTFNGGSCLIDDTGPDRVQAPVSLFSATQGWFAIRLAPTWAATDQPYGAGADMRVFCYRNASDANRLEILYKEASDAWQIVRLVGSVGAVATGPAQSFAANSHHTVVGTWDSGSVKISSDAGAFVSASSGNVPSLPNSVFEIGNRDDGLRAVKAACYWVAIGSGVTLTDTDVSGLNGFGDTDPTWDTLPAGRKLLWTADDPTYLDAAPPATVIRPRTIRAVRQIPARF